MSNNAISNETDLDWLVRNVHKWPCGKHQPWCYVVTKIDGERTWASNVLSRSFPYSLVDKDKWLARRAELQNKPSWRTHEYKVIAQGRNGSWYGSNYSEEKFGHENSFCITGTGWNFICGGVNLGDWRDTLEKRPEQTIADICREVTGENRHEEIFEPFVSVEDAKITIMQSDGDVKHFGGIIGRSLPLKEDAATAKQHDPVNSPSHYASGGIECIDAIKASMSHEAFLGYLKGNVQKYMWRYEKKVNPSEDLKKARWYLDKLIEEQK